MKRNLTTVLITLLAVFLLVTLAGCPKYTKAESDRDLYFKALGFWTDTYANFKFVFESSTPAQQKEMMKPMVYLLEAKQKVLNPWKKALDAGASGDVYSRERAWKQYEDQIILTIINKYLT